MGGASLNIGSLHEGILGNIELSPGHNNEKVHVDVSYVKRGIPQFHFNMYLHTDGLEQVPQVSSIHRLARGKQITDGFNGSITENGKTLVTDVVSDHADAAFPVYRTNASVETAASGLFDLGEGTFSIWFDRPIVGSSRVNASAQADYVFDMRSRALTLGSATSAVEYQQTQLSQDVL